MRSALLFISMLTASLISNGQLQWKIRQGSKLVMQTNKEDISKNRIIVKKSQLISANSWTLSYKKAADEKDWIRTVMVNDSTGSTLVEFSNPLKAKKSATEVCYNISSKQMAQLLNKHRTITVYISSIPSDPDKAAVVRIRPVHVCTFSVQ